ncbi:MAG: hypothetical protein AB8G99_11065, partial [Planctomycetaceae bacterium]
MNDSQLVKLFEQALSKRGNERQAFLDSLGAQERQQIEQLLAADESAEHRGLFQPVVKGIAKQKLSAPELGSTVAPNSERGEHTAV